MLASLKMEIVGEDISYKKASSFQGVLFEKIESGYAEFLHNQQMHPYSQYLCKEQDKVYWYINTLDKDAYQNIIQTLKSQSFQSFYLKHGNTEVQIISKEEKNYSYEALLADFYKKKADRNLSISLKSVTSFKQRGRYNVVPDLRLIYQNLMMRYSAVAGNENMIDADALEELVDESMITRYRLKTATFPMEGRMIPGYIGDLTIHINGTETMARYARMLFQFGEYSGVGIKTAMGMGALELREEKNAR